MSVKYDSAAPRSAVFQETLDKIIESYHYTHVNLKTIHAAITVQVFYKKDDQELDFSNSEFDNKWSKASFNLFKKHIENAGTKIKVHPVEDGEIFFIVCNKKTSFAWDVERLYEKGYLDQIGFAAIGFYKLPKV